MQLRMLARRSLNGSMTIVGDIAQATGAWAHADWDEILEHLPDRAARRAGPSSRSATASRRRTWRWRRGCCAVAAPDLAAAASVREDGDAAAHRPRRRPTETSAARSPTPSLDERDAVGPGNVAVIVPSSLVDVVAVALERAGVEFGSATRHGLDQQVTVVPVGLVKGLELDAIVVVEPAAIVDEEAQGLRALTSRSPGDQAPRDRPRTPAARRPARSTLRRWRNRAHTPDTLAREAAAGSGQ